MELTGLICNQIDFQGAKSVMAKNLTSKIRTAQLLSLSLSVLISQAAISASTDQSKRGSLNKPPAKPIDLMTAYQKIQSPPEFADLPVFSGQSTFVGGYYMPEQNGISMCQMKFFAKEEPKEVISFYTDALSNNGWKILNASSNHLTARHTSSHMCSVNVSEARLPKTKSQYTIVYRQVNRQH